MANGPEIVVYRDTLRCPSKVRKYILAHELGQGGGCRHPAITGAAATLALIPILVFTWPAQLNFAPDWHFSDTWQLAPSICLAVGAVVLAAREASMWFEWDADRRGARMVGDGSMRDGMARMKAEKGAK